MSALRPATKALCGTALAMLLLAALGTVAITLESNHAAREVLFPIDEQGFIVGDIPNETFSSALSGATEGHRNLLPFCALLALGSTAHFGIAWFSAWGLAQRERFRALAWVVAPILVPLLVIPAAGVLVDADRHIPLGEGLYSWLTGRELRHPGPCSLDCHEQYWTVHCWHREVVDFQISATITATILVCWMLLIPGLSVALRARGNRPGLHASAMTLFMLGWVAIAFTTPHAADRARLEDSCPAAERWIRPNEAPPEIDAPWVIGCERVRPGRRALLAALMVDEQGRLTDHPRSSWHSLNLRVDEKPGRLASLVAEERRKWLELTAGEDAEFALSIYADQRAPLDASVAHLRALRQVGVRHIVLEGQSHDAGQLATVGAWIRRQHCEVGELSFENPVYRVDEFATWGEVQALARDLAPEPLRLGL